LYYKDKLLLNIQCRLGKVIISSAWQFSLRALRNLCIFFAVKGILELIQKPQRAPSLVQRTQRNSNFRFLQFKAGDPN